MRYIRVRWIHSFPTEPVEIYSESDENGWETRKIEIFGDGSASCASSIECTGSSRLATIPIAPVQEITDSQFQACEVTKREFEACWERVTG